MRDALTTSYTSCCAREATAFVLESRVIYVAVPSHSNRQRVCLRCQLELASVQQWMDVLYWMRKQHNRYADKQEPNRESRLIQIIAVCLRIVNQTVGCISATGTHTFTITSEHSFGDATEIFAVILEEGLSKKNETPNRMKQPGISCNILIYYLPVFHINLGRWWPQVVRIIFMIFGDMRRFSRWWIQHQCLLLETVMTDQDTIHKSGACGEGGWHWCMLGQWKMPQRNSKRQKDMLNDFISGRQR